LTKSAAKAGDNQHKAASAIVKDKESESTDNSELKEMKDDIWRLKTMYQQQKAAPLTNIDDRTGTIASTLWVGISTATTSLHCNISSWS